MDVSLGVLSGALCLPHTVTLVAPTSPMPPSLPANAPRAAKGAVKLADEDAVCAYDQEVLAYGEVLPLSMRFTLLTLSSLMKMCVAAVLT